MKTMPLQQQKQQTTKMTTSGRSNPKSKHPPPAATTLTIITTPAATQQQQRRRHRRRRNDNDNCSNSNIKTSTVIDTQRQQQQNNPTKSHTQMKTNGSGNDNDDGPNTGNTSNITQRSYIMNQSSRLGRHTRQRCTDCARLGRAGARDGLVARCARVHLDGRSKYRCKVVCQLEWTLKLPERPRSLSVHLEGRSTPVICRYVKPNPTTVRTRVLECHCNAHLDM